MILRALIFLFLLVLPHPTFAVIAFDASSEGSAGASSLTFSHTTSGSNRILWCGTYVSDSATVSGVTYNSVAMTSAGTAVLDADGRRQYLWYLLAPATGANNVVVSATPGSPNIRAVCASYTGAQQSGVPDAYATKDDTTNVSSFSHNITTVANNAWIVMTGLTDQIMTGTGSATMREEHADQSYGLFDTNGAITPAGSTAMGFSVSFSTTRHSILLASFAPDTGGSAATPTRTLLGVGQ